jgi:predicted porin
MLIKVTGSYAMKKTLLATAIAVSIAAPAIASAAGPTLYGQAHYHVGYVKGYDPTTKESDSGIDVSSNTSRLGVKGAFDLGGGLQAIYMMEWGVNLTGDQDEGGDWSERNRYGGFKSDTWGTVIVGRHDTPVKVIGRKVDLFWSTQLGQNRSVTAQRDGGAGFDNRFDNTIGYISPNFGPVHIFAAYIADHNITPAVSNPASSPLTDNNDFSAYSIAGMYDQKNLFSGDDNLYIAVGYEQHNIEKAAAAPAGTEDSENMIRVTAKYSFGNWAIPILYQKGDKLGFASDVDRDVFGGGLSYKMGASTIKGAVYSAGKLGGTDDSGALHYALGIDHELSKNTQVYFQGTALANDKNASLTLGGNGTGVQIPGANDETSYGIVVGSRIKF